jgi:ABC-type antimicrobial peptide transport system permease subunit
LTTFAAIALALSALGLFGVLSYGVKLRSREFGIRMALGAESRTIAGMVVEHALTVTALGMAIGLMGALALSRLMTSVLFEVSPLDPRVMTGTIVFMGIVAAIAAWLPTHRATAVDPRAALH